MNFTLFKFLHVAAMFAAVTVGVGAQIVLQRVAHTRKVGSIRGVFSQAPWLERLSLILFASGVVFGLIAAALGSYNFLAPWLLIAYGLIVLVGLNGSFVLGRWTKEVEAESKTSADNAPSPELERLVSSRFALAALIVDILLFLAIIFGMIAKPGGIQ